MFQGNELNSESTGSIRNAPTFVPLPRSRIGSTLKNLPTGNLRKWDLKMRMDFDWHWDKFHHTAFISNKDFCHFHASNSLLHPSKWGSEGAATELGWLTGLNYKRTFLTVPGQLCPRAAVLPGCDLLWQFSRCNPHLQQKCKVSCLFTSCLIFENWIQQFQKSKKIGTALLIKSRVSSCQGIRDFICFKLSSNKIVNDSRVVWFCKIFKISHFPNHRTWVNGPSWQSTAV